MSESLIMIVLRLIHIISGVFWAGAVMSIAWFLLPAQQAIGQPGGAFMQQLMFRQRFRAFVLAAMVLTILSGLTMYARLAMLTHGAWASSRTGIVLGIGAVAAIIAGGIGGGFVRRLGNRMMELGGRIQASGGPPTDTEKAEMDALQRKTRSGFRIVAILLLISIVAMASARYL